MGILIYFNRFDNSFLSDSHEGKEQNHDGLEGEKGWGEEPGGEKEVKRRRGTEGDRGKRAEEGETVVYYLTTTVPDQ